jgi:hypothetical protein
MGIGRSKRGLAAALLGILLVALPVLAVAQTGGTTARLAPFTPAPNEAVPKSISDAALRDDLQSQGMVSDYLGQPLPDRDAVVIRGQSLLYDMQLRNASPAQIDWARGEIRRRACSAIIINTDIDRDYLPPRTAIAFDLQPVNGVLARGFTPITIGDPRITAAGGVVRNPTQPLDGDSLDGVTSFVTPLANGRWRVILMTDKLGQFAARGPFGLEVNGNGQRIGVGNLPPPRWLVQGYLTNKVVQPGLAQVGAIGPGGAPMLTQGDLLSDEAGAVIFEVDVINGSLRLNFATPASLVGIVLEPAEAGSSMQLVGGARNGPALIDQCFNYENRIGQYIPRGSPYLGSPVTGGPGGGGGPGPSPH